MVQIDSVPDSPLLHYSSEHTNIHTMVKYKVASALFGFGLLVFGMRSSALTISEEDHSTYIIALLPKGDIVMRL